ncbi:MAG TPA: LLM class flavin-dependent oxidoreductase [Dehalococcoidia bacterium]|nr:LLM class flavin-dependent oxidoreductase [Dehalococcoidia bacterium]
MPARSGLKLGVALPQGFPDGKIDLRLIEAYAREAEAMGFDDLWTIEQITGSLPVLEPVSLLAYLAAITERIRLGTAVVVTNLRNPVQLAKAVASIDHLSNGRLTLGVGLGVSTRMYAAFGIEEEHRVARFLEGIRVMKALWTEPSANLEGRYFRLKGVSMEPKPVQKPHPPLWFGAHTEAAQRRAARHGDGWMGAGSTKIEDFFVELGRMRAILQEEGRDLASFPLSKRIYISVDDDESRARERMQAWLDGFYGRPEARAEAWGVYGSSGRCLETLQRMRDAGLTHVMLHPAPADLAQLETIATRIVPEL